MDIIMKAKYNGISDPIYFIKDKIYDVVGLVNGLPNHYRIIDETGEDYVYSLKNFEIVERFK